jgi:hypothetical protein
VECLPAHSGHNVGMAITSFVLLSRQHCRPVRSALPALHGSDRREARRHCSAGCVGESSLDRLRVRSGARCRVSALPKSFCCFCRLEVCSFDCSLLTSTLQRQALSCATGKPELVGFAGTSLPTIPPYH